MKDIINKALHKVLILFTIIFISFSLSMNAFAEEVSGDDSTLPPHVPDVVLVKFKAGASDVDKNNARNGVGAIKHNKVAKKMNPNLEKITLPAGSSVNSAVTNLKGNPHVLYAEPDYIIKLKDTPLVVHDPKFTDGTLWNMYSDQAYPENYPTNTYGSRAIDAWKSGFTGLTSQIAIIGVIDTGIDLDHPDLAANIWTNPNEIPGDGIDNDGNGYIDDIHGCNFINPEADPSQACSDAAITDDDGHGSHIAGSIGAVSNNIGVIGVNPNVKMISVKSFNVEGLGTISSVVAGIEYLTQLKTAGNNIVAINASFGTTVNSQALYEAINTAGSDAGILTVASAGNDGKIMDVDLLPPFGIFFYNYPAAYVCNMGNDVDCIISVTALNSLGQEPDFANVGAVSVDFAAPGVGIYSTSSNGTYEIKEGTSMSAAHVSGAVALCASIIPLEYNDAVSNLALIRKAVMETVIPTAGWEGRTVTGGRLDVGAMMTECHDIFYNPVILLILPSSGTLDFGSVVIGEFRDLIVEIKNAGNDNLEFTGTPTINNSVFSLISPDVSAVAPGATREFTVRYSPTAIQSDMGVMVIASNDVENPSIEVNLIGAGVEASIPPGELINDVLTFMDEHYNVDLIALGNGNSAPHRFNALKNMINAAGDLIAAGDIAGACDQLKDAELKTDGLGSPGDFVGGDAAPILVDMIKALEMELGCQ